MVSFYGPDALKIISDHLRLSRNESTDEIWSLPNTSQEQPDLKKKILDWLHEISKEERERVIIVHNGLITFLLLQLYFRQLLEGDLEISLKPVNGSKMSLEEYFYIRKADKSPYKKYERLLRATDTYKYLDSLTLDPQILRSGESLIRYMNKVSQGHAFATPCSSSDSGQWEYPAWFSPHGYNSLSSWACALIEQSIWKSFRRTQELCSVYLSSKQELSQWPETPSKILSALRDLNTLEKEFRTAKVQLYSCVERIVTYWSVSDHFQQSDPDSEDIREMAMFYQNSSSLSWLVIHLGKTSLEEYLDCLTYSPFERVFSICDIIARKIFLRLVNTEEKPSQSRSESCSTRNSCEDDYRFIREFVLELIDQSVPSHIEEIPTAKLELQGFKVVKRHKRKKARKALNKPTSLAKMSAEPLTKLMTQPAGRRLHKEIEDFVHHVRAKTGKRLQAISLIIGHIHQLVNMIFPNSKIALYGSYGAGLALEGSDVDLQIYNPAFCTRESIQCALYELTPRLGYFPWIENCQCIATASIPVLKLEVMLAYFSTETSGNLKVDITFDDSGDENNHLGLKSLEYTIESLELHKPLEYLVIVLKSFLAANGLNHAYTGGISSYSLLVWVLAYLNNTNDPTIDDFGVLLEGICKFYGCQFKRESQAICANGYFLKTDSSYITTLDPVRSDNNITRTSYNCESVLRLFADVYQLICNNKGLKEILATKFLG